MDVVGDIVSGRSSRRPAIRAPGRVYSHHDLYTSTAQARNLLEYLGASGGAHVEIEPELRPETVIAFFGATGLGAIADLTPTGDAPVVVTRADREPEYDLDPGRKLVVYDGVPPGPEQFEWELDVWSQSPEPSADLNVARGDAALATADRTYSHGDLLDAAERLVDEHEMTEDTEVAVRAPIGNPGTVAAGVVAPIMAGGTILFPAADDLGDIGIGTEVAEPVEIDSAQVFGED